MSLVFEDCSESNCTTSLVNVTYNETFVECDSGYLTANNSMSSGFFHGTVYAMYCPVLIVAVLGNGAVCFIVSSTPRMQTVTNFFIANLAVGDLLMAIFCVPFTFMPLFILYYWPFGAMLCPVVNFSQAVSVFVSAYTLVAISIDRYMAIMWPLKPRLTKRYAAAIIFVVWLFAFITALPIAIVSRLKQPSPWHEQCDRYVCTEDWPTEKQNDDYSMALMILQFVIPLIVLIYTYTSIAIVVWCKRIPGEAENSRDQRFARSKRKICPTTPAPWLNMYSNNHNNLGYDLSLQSTEESYDFTSRFMQMIKQIYVWLYYEWIYLPEVEKITQNYFPLSVPPIKDVARMKTEGILVNYVSPMGQARPYAQNVLEIGGLQCKPPQKLPHDLEKYISDAGEHGIIYFSLGSTVSDLNLSPKIKTSILNVFQKLPQRILWKSERTNENLPKNVMIRKWCPQQDILGHNKTRLFITQGGMLSMQEAVYHGVPCLILPIFLDQYTNGNLAQRMGYSKVMKLTEFDENIFHKYILELISNHTYRKRVKEISEAMKDQLVPKKDKFKRWINFIIKHKKSYLKPMTSHLSYIELLELDIYFTILLVIIILLVTLITILRKLFIFAKKIFYRNGR